MITRLLQLELQGFRSILQRQTIPLDADAVVIYGPNGTGKSGILAAIEFALTGAVSDLARFDGDYPRCLSNVRSTVPGEVVVTFETDRGSRERLAATVGRTRELQREDLPLDERKSYVERCFLSQSRLSRLLDSYLSTEEAGGEQTLLRFGRELLGLDLLEDLAIGLFEIADIRRIRNNSPTYQQLLNAKEATDEEVQRLERFVELRTASFESAFQSFKLLYPQQLSSDVSSDLSHIEDLETKRLAERRIVLSRSRALNARLENAVALLEASTSTYSLDLETLQPELDKLRLERADIERRLQPVVEGLENDVISEDLGSSPDKMPDKATQIEELEDILKRRLISVDSERKSIDDLDRERRTLEARIAEVTSTLALLSEATPAGVEERRQWVGVLRTIASRIHANSCPICGRDYSELATGILREKVLQEAEAIDKTLKAAERDSSSRAVLQSDQRELGKQIATLTVQIERGARRRQELERIEVRYRERLAVITASTEDRARYKSVLAEIRRLESSILENQVRLDQRKQALGTIQTIAMEAGISTEANPELLSVERARQIREALSKQMTVSQSEAEHSLQLQETAKLARSLDSDIRNLRIQLKEKRVQQAKLEVGCHQVEQVIQRARNLRSTAIEVKSELLNWAFTATLNRLWREFFDRLAPAERFHPEMTEPIMIRNVIHTNVSAVASNVERFNHVASVLSSGNLNTAALSLFLALHVMDRTSHRLIVLDDPVQSIDDVHISQMAILLRALMTQAGRQIVVAVHDRELFDYLSLEFAPTEQGRRLILIEIQRTGTESDAQILCKTKDWAPTIRFGT